jgi:hypothetical protein
VPWPSYLGFFLVVAFAVGVFVAFFATCFEVLFLLAVVGGATVVVVAGGGVVLVGGALVVRVAGGMASSPTTGSLVSPPLSKGTSIASPTMARRIIARSQRSCGEPRRSSRGCRSSGSPASSSSGQSWRRAGGPRQTLRALPRTTTKMIAAIRPTMRNSYTIGTLFRSVLVGGDVADHAGARFLQPGTDARPCRCLYVALQTFA